MFTHSLLGPVHRRLPDQRVVTELHLVSMHHVPAVYEQDKCSCAVQIISCDLWKNFKQEPTKLTISLFNL